MSGRVVASLPAVSRGDVIKTRVKQPIQAEWSRHQNRQRINYLLIFIFFSEFGETKYTTVKITDSGRLYPCTGLLIKPELVGAYMYVLFA